MADQAVNWPVFIRELQAAEQVWNTRPVKYPRDDAVPWMPLHLSDFAMLLTEAMEVVPYRSPWTDVATSTAPWIAGRNRMIDVGCGPGTKLRFAHALFGLNCFGIDIVQRFVDETNMHGIRAAPIDAFDFPVGMAGGEFSASEAPTGPYSSWGYSDFDIVYVNRPSGLVDELEGLIMDRMADEAVLIAVNWMNDPGRQGFTVHFQEESSVPGQVRGVWIKG